MGAVAWLGELGEYADTLPYEVRGMLRSRANTIEGGTTEINKNILGERVLGLPREADPSVRCRGGRCRAVELRVALVIERRGAVGWSVFNRPSPRQRHGCADAGRPRVGLARAGRRSAVRVIVNTGEGGHSRPGSTSSNSARDPDALRKQSGRTRRAELSMTSWHNQVWKPVIATLRTA